MRNRQFCAKELTGQIDGECAFPVRKLDVFTACRRPGDAGVVDQHVEAAETREDVVEQSPDGAFV